MAMGIKNISMLEAERIHVTSSHPQVKTESSYYSGDTALRGGKGGNLDTSAALIQDPNDDLGRKHPKLLKQTTPAKVLDTLDIEDAKLLKVSDFPKYSAKAYAELSKRNTTTAEHKEQRKFELKRSLKVEGETLDQTYDKLKAGRDRLIKDKPNRSNWSPEEHNLEQRVGEHEELKELENQIPELRKQAAMFDKLAKKRQTLGAYLWGYVQGGGMAAFTGLNILMMAVSIPSMFQQMSQMVPHHSKRDDGSQGQQMPSSPPPSMVNAQQQLQAQSQQNPYQGATYPPASAYAQGPPPLQSAFMSGTQPPPPGYYGQNPYGTGG